MLRSVTGEARTVRRAASRPTSTPPQLCSQTLAPVLLSSSSVRQTPRPNSEPLKPAVRLTSTAPLTKRPTVVRAVSPVRREASVRSAFSYSDFAKQLALKPGATGAIAPSSQLLAQKTISQARLEDARTVVELGSGTGVFTEEILQNTRCDQTFFAIELNRTFVSATRSRCPEACVYHDAASSLPFWLQKHNKPQADRIISSLPWTIFDKPVQDEMMNVIGESLSEDGIFVSIIYLGAKFRSRGRYFIKNLQHHFSSVNHTPIVWRNLPPSQIFCCVK